MLNIAQSGHGVTPATLCHALRAGPHCCLLKIFYESIQIKKILKYQIWEDDIFPAIFF